MVLFAMEKDTFFPRRYGMEEEEEEGNTHLLVLKRKRRMDHPLARCD